MDTSRAFYRRSTSFQEVDRQINKERQARRLDRVHAEMIGKERDSSYHHRQHPNQYGSRQVQFRIFRRRLHHALER